MMKSICLQVLNVLVVIDFHFFHNLQFPFSNDAYDLFLRE